ncbi:MAG: UDP-2,3-diacylglucosamine diphosphatase [Rhizobiaceae bacterium]|nr:UDP-2,3-diacylglucosamine diphosphatase [Rhizobiaceae bacterium]
MQQRVFRTLFISDVHLGSAPAQAAMLIEFLRWNDADTIYLVGDIVDGWRLRRSWYWPQLHNDVVQKMLRKARKGARIIYVPGNHDEFLRDFPGTHFGGIEVVENIIHEGANGKRYLVMHGDEFDLVVRNARVIAYLGDWAYDFAIWCNRHISRARRMLGLSYWSFSAWAKNRVKRAVNFIGAFEQAVADEARRRTVDGIICGHIHQPANRDFGGIAYMNCGDWVETCSAIGENFDGTFEVLMWAELRKRIPADAIEPDAVPLAAE